jgi:streptogramin lyase
VKVGLEENGQCIDRDGNGTIETSRDLNADGVISSNEVLDWGKDECVLCETIVIPGKEGAYKPGEYKGSYSGSSGPRGIAIDENNNLWAGIYSGRKYYYIDGRDGKIHKTIDVASVGHNPYGAVIDKNGILWSSSLSGRHLLKLNTKNYSFKRVNIPHTTYGIALDNNNHIFVAGWTYNKLSRVNILSDNVDWTVRTSGSPKGVAVDNNGDVWVANYYDNKVTRWSNDGTQKASIRVGSMPSGVAIDAAGKPWAVNYGDGYLKRINPATNTVELEKLIQGKHYSYSDMTGIVARSMTTRIGTWTVVFDSGAENTKWGTEIKNTPVARYLQVETTMQILSGETSPILNHMSISFKQ